MKSMIETGQKHSTKRNLDYVVCFNTAKALSCFLICSQPNRKLKETHLRWREKVEKW